MEGKPAWQKVVKQLQYDIAPSTASSPLVSADPVSRAEFLLKKNNLEGAVLELEQDAHVRQNPQVQQWLKEAHEYLNVKQSLEVMKLHVDTLVNSVL